MKTHLKYVIEYQKPHYPEEYDVCNTYAQKYHRRLQYEISVRTEYELPINVIHCVLSWIKTTYPNKILRDPALIDHINEDQLGDLLPAGKICHLENMYKNYQQGNLEQWMTKALEMEEKCWYEGRQPEIRSVSYSELSVDILQICKDDIKAAKEISEDFVNKTTPVLLNEFLKFLKRYKRSIENYLKKNKGKPHYKETIIANMNCCSNFRGFIECVSAGEDIKKEMYSVLSEIENQGYGILLQDLFKDLKSHFRGLSQTKVLISQETMQHIITTANTYVSSITIPTAPCHQVMSGKVHRHLVQKYLTKMKAIRQCNIYQQKALAAQMRNTADLFSQFCTDHLNDTQMSEATWVNNAIRKIAEIISLQDLEAIKLEVAVLSQEYPDIKKRHVKSFLFIKNNLTNSERMSAVRIMETIKCEDKPDRKLFTFIPCLPCYWLIY